MKQIFTLVIAMAITAASSAQTITRTASTVSNVTSTGRNDVTWNTGASSSSVTLTRNALLSDYLVVSGYNLTVIPTSVTITSLSVTYNMSANAALSDSAVRLVIGGAIYGAAGSNAAPNPPAAIPTVAGTQVTYNFTPSGLQGVTGGMVREAGFGIALAIQRTNSTQNLSYTATVNNSVTITVGWATLAPIILTDFTAVKNAENGVDIRFATSTEDNVQALYVQRSGNGRDFENLFTIAPKGAPNVYTKYTVVDKTPLQGNNYYRIAEMDRNGRWYYYTTKLVSVDAKARSFNAYYNGGQVVANISNVTGQYEVSLVDMAGITISRKQVNMTGRSAQVMLDAPSRAGVYVVILKGQGTAESTRVAIVK